MANTTGLTNKVAQTPWTTDRKLELSAETVGSTSFFYDGQAVGRDTAGYLVQMDDSAKAEFVGILVSVVDKIQINSTDVIGQNILRVMQPQMFTANIASASFGDEGRKVYWKYNNEVAYSGINNWNYAGTVWLVLQPTGQSTINQVMILPPWLSRTAGGEVTALQSLSAGTTTLNKFGVNTDYLGTDTIQINLPVSTTVSSGDQMTFIKSGSGAYTITLKPQGTDSINAATTQFNSTTVQFTRIVAETDGAGQWFVRQF